LYDRVLRCLEKEGPQALYQDAELLRALAAEMESSPASAAAAREMVRKHKGSLRELDRALRPLLEELREDRRLREGPKTAQVAGYVRHGGCIYFQKPTLNGDVLTPLCNFDARIVEQVTHDDGAERHIALALEGSRADGVPLPRIEVPASQFGAMNFVVEAWGTGAVVYAGQGTRDHLRAALQLLSGDAPHRTAYGHTGWRLIEGEWFYLHAGGAIGPEGPVADICVNLPPPLAGFLLPEPPTGEVLRRAVLACLAILRLGPGRIVFPALACAFRAALGAADYALALCGPTGVFKTELAALIQQLWGAGLDARHLPASWASTGNSLEALAFAAKDAPLVVDDFAPGGSAADVQRQHKEADRLLRAQGNHAGRQRLRSDASLRPEKQPRGTIVSTGEDLPRGQSLRARMFICQVSPGDINREKLTAAQRDAAAGLYAQAMSGFIAWLAPRYAEVSAGLRRERDEVRQRLLNGHFGHFGHSRAPTATAEILLGIQYLTRFALEAGAIDADECRQLREKGQESVLEAAELQADHVRAADPTAVFVRLLAQSLTSGRAHLASTEGKEPAEAPAALGWKYSEFASGDRLNSSWSAQGRKVGWVDGEFCLLLPDAAYAEVQRLAGEHGEALAVSPQTLWRRLHEKQLLAVVDERGKKVRYAVRRVLEGEHQHVIILRRDTLFPLQDGGQSGQTGGDPSKNGHSPMATFRVTGHSHGKKWPSEVAIPPEENTEMATLATRQRGGDPPPARRNHTHAEREPGEEG
jgi:hypothetical protein